VYCPGVCIEELLCQRDTQLTNGTLT